MSGLPDSSAANAYSSPPGTGCLPPRCCAPSIGSLPHLRVTAAAVPSPGAAPFSRIWGPNGLLRRLPCFDGDAGGLNLFAHLLDLLLQQVQVLLHITLRRLRFLCLDVRFLAGF